MSTSITSQVASALAAQGKAAVEAELTRIESDISSAVSKGKAEAATLAAQLAVHLDAHTAEVSTANALLSRTNAIAANGTTNPSAVPGASPALSLTAPSAFSAAGAKIEGVIAWIKNNGWKGYAALGVGILVLHFLWTHKII